MKQYTKDNWMRENPLTYTFRRTDVTPTPAHTHDFIEFVYVSEGNARHTVNGTVYDLRGGDLLYVGKDAVHTIELKKSFSYFNVAIYPDAEEHALQNRLCAVAGLLPEGHGVIRVPNGKLRELETLLNMMLRECSGSRAFRADASAAYTDCFLIHVVRLLMGDTEGDDVWSEAVRYIEDNLDGDLSLLTLSKRCFYNASYFSRTFKERYGVTLSEFVTQRRLKKARELLVTTKQPIAQIIKAVGFHNKSFFYKTFQRYFGITPLQCRRLGEEWLQEALLREEAEENEKN